MQNRTFAFAFACVTLKFAFGSRCSQREHASMLFARMTTILLQRPRLEKGAPRLEEGGGGSRA